MNRVGANNHLLRSCKSRVLPSIRVTWIKDRLEVDEEIAIPLDLVSLTLGVEEPTSWIGKSSEVVAHDVVLAVEVVLAMILFEYRPEVDRTQSHWRAFVHDSGHVMVVRL